MKCLAVYEDVTWENQPIDLVRFTSRVFIHNSKGEYAFLKIVGEDFLGDRCHLETCGGGVEDNESFLDAAKREVMEELGIQAKNYQEIGAIFDRLNPLRRMTCSVFFEAEAIEGQNETNRTDEEKILIEQILWLTPEKALEQLKVAYSPIDAFVHRRDLTAFLALLESKKDRR